MTLRQLKKMMPNTSEIESHYEQYKILEKIIQMVKKDGDSTEMLISKLEMLNISLRMLINSFESCEYEKQENKTSKIKKKQVLST